MAKKKLYTVQCSEHNDTFAASGGVSFNEAKQLVKAANDLAKALPFMKDKACKLKVVEYRTPRTTFDQAFAAAAFGPMEGLKIARDGWNGKGLFVQAQYPDENSKMGNPYLYIDATALGGKRNPWVPSQTDLFADDWYIVEEA